MSFLKAFSSILHAVEVAAQIAAPIIQTVDPAIGSLMIMATSAAIGVEASVTAKGQGAAKAAAVTASTKAAVDVINGILASQGKGPLPANTTDVVAQQVGTVVASLNAVAVATAPAA